MSDYSTEDLLMLESLVSKMGSQSIPTPQEVNTTVDSYYEEDELERTPRLDVADELEISVMTPLRGKIQAYSGTGQAVSPNRVVETLQEILTAVQGVVDKYSNLGLIEDETTE